MQATFDYLFYCFYCLTSEKKFDRAGASRSGLFLFVTFALVNIYICLTFLTNSTLHFFVAGIMSAVFAQSLLHYTYYRSQAYAPLVARYALGEPHRLRFALAGCALLLCVVLLPFVFMKIRHL